MGQACTTHCVPIFTPVGKSSLHSHSRGRKGPGEGLAEFSQRLQKRPCITTSAQWFQAHAVELTAWGHTPALLCPSYGNLGKGWNLPEPQFPHL